MFLNDYDFTLPEELIAQTPATRRDASRLMCLKRESEEIFTGQFPDIVNWFRSGDVLVFNDTRVIPARLLGQKETGGKVEILLVRHHSDWSRGERWLCLTKSSRPIKPGTIVNFDQSLQAEVLDFEEDPYRLVQFSCRGDFIELVESLGRLPLPPYIRREDDEDDRERYQTVFARERGAVAAPTAGLHFTAALLQELEAQGVELCALTLHVGLGTFLPVRVEDPRDHKMHSEIYSIPDATAARVNRARAEGRRVIALGTTSARTLETAVSASGALIAGRGESEIFIYPGHRFKMIDALVTNFHLPKSTLLMLVSAFAGREFTLKAYRRAVEERFRFFSYGDCMMIV